MIPGGEWNRAGGNYSFAAGFESKANHSGAFVWSDTTGVFASTDVKREDIFVTTKL